MSARAELLAIIARLEVMSHVPAVNLDPTPAATTDAKGGARPRGGIDRKDDQEHDFALKSADHYRRRLNGCRTMRDVELVLVDARRTVIAWTRTPVKGIEPKPGDPLWKRWVAECDLDDHTVARRYNMNVRHIRRIREDYGHVVRDS